MTQNELSLLESELKRCTCYLEFGSGNSTRMAARTASILRIDSVESDPEFFGREVATDSAVRQAVAGGRLVPHFPYIGKTQDWGHPTDSSCEQLWPDYSVGVFAGHRDWDLVLVDGRFRVACGLSVFLTLPGSTRVLVHDFSWRRQYRRLLRYADIVSRVDSFVLLQRRANFDRAGALRDLKTYLFLPADQTPFQQRINGYIFNLNTARLRLRKALPISG